MYHIKYVVCFCIFLAKGIYYNRTVWTFFSLFILQYTMFYFIFEQKWITFLVGRKNNTNIYANLIPHSVGKNFVLRIFQVIDRFHCYFSIQFQNIISTLSTGIPFDIIANQIIFFTTLTINPPNAHLPWRSKALFTSEEAIEWRIVNVKRLLI